MTADERLRILTHELRSPVAALDALAAVARELPPGGLPRIARLATAAGEDLERLLSDPDVLSLRPRDVELASLVEPLARPGVTVSAGSGSLRCDPTRLRQALGNLVENGLRHGTAVTVTAGRHRDRALFEVADDGSGISVGIDVFERGVSGAGSSGYGLWLARAIAEAHGGELTVDSTPAGATFSLAVPLPPGASG